jgi:anti-anti-sigma factor
MNTRDYTLRYYTEDDVCIMPLVGEFDLSNAAEIETLIVAAVKGGKPVIVDFSATDYIDSTVLSVLVRQWKRVGRHLRIVVPRASHIRRVFEVTGLVHRLSVSDTLDDAKSVTRPTG